MHSANLPEGFEHREYMHICYAMIDVCEAVCLLPGWETSPGARMERDYAEAHGKPAVEFKPRRDFAEEVKDLFNEICTSLPKVRQLTETRRQAIRRRSADIEEFRRVFEAVEKSDFMSGRSGKGWKADFDWILKAQNWVRIQEGVHSNTSRGGFNDHPQRRYNEADLSHLFVDLG